MECGDGIAALDENGVRERAKRAHPPLAFMAYVSRFRLRSARSAES
jgi:hypothetical protein